MKVFLSSYTPTIEIASPQQVIKNLQKIAIPAIALVGALMAPQAQATDTQACWDLCEELGRQGHSTWLCYLMCFVRDIGKTDL